MANASARETAYQWLRDRIIHLELKPGEALNDKELAEQIGMSRTPVREAILMLSMAQLVVVRPQSGTFVTPINLEIVELEQFARYALEKEVALRVCRMEAPGCRQLYEENLHLYQFYLSSQAPDREEKMLDLDNQFHRIAFLADHKEHHFRRMLDGLHHIERYRVLSLMVIQDTQVYQDHVHIAQAVIQRDGEEAARWLDLHMHRYQEHLRAIQATFPQYF